MDAEPLSDWERIVLENALYAYVELKEADATLSSRYLELRNKLEGASRILIEPRNPKEDVS